jgi:glycosyltransferase involved in cell wall biosynthesis
VTFAGRVDDDGLVDLYQRAWVVASASSHEGWGMTLTEAAACGTPAVATRIPGHLDALQDGVGGLLGEGDDELVEHLSAVLTDEDLRRRLSEGALRRAGELTWDATAYGTLAVLADEARRKAPRT